jgi:hypothetical protein
MSLADKASLLLIPTGYKSQKVYSIFPTDGVGDFDFSRSSSATRIAKNGLITTVAANVPRLEYPLIDGVVNGCPSLLLEPQRTNLLTYSEDISNSVWTTLASGETIVSNSIISPDGTLNADTLEGDGTATNVYVRQDITLTTSTDYTFSIFAKKGTNDFLAISAEGFSGATNTLLIFDLKNSIVTNGTGNIENYGNGWLRCSFTTTISTDGTGRFLIYPAYNGATRGFPTSSDANGQNIYLWGAMLEEGSFPTSYIKTNGEINGVTRSAETANGSGDAATFSDSEGVLMAEISALDNDGNFRRVGVSDNSVSDRVIVGFTNVSNQIQGFVSSNGSVVSNMNYTVSDAKTNNKVCLRYKQDYHSLWINGFEVLKTLNANTPIGLSDLSFDSGASAEQFYGKTKQIQYYKSVLTESELEKLTSWTSFSDMANGQQYSII